ncbi:MAG: hypothetical protein Q4D20_09905 [Clostridia bacterium]|nr:hypothetical protein [Clostridia bacterium]
MKKSIALLLVFIMCLSLCACTPKKDTEPQKEIHHIGDSVKTEFFEFELKKAEFTEWIYTGTGWFNSKRKDEKFFTPCDSDTLGSFSVDVGSDEVYLYYCFTFKYIGKGELVESLANYFLPSVNYEDYTFNSDYFSFCRTINSTETSDWHNFGTDFDAVSWVQTLNLEFGYIYKIKPLSDDIYEVRGIIPVPSTVAKDTSVKPILKLGDAQFVIE